MNQKTYNTLELSKILDRVAGYAAFTLSGGLLRNLEPTNDLDEALRRQQETSEARDLLGENPAVTIGGARDVRHCVRDAERGITLNPGQLLEVRATLESAARLRQTLEKVAERYPLLNQIATNLDGGKGIVAEIARIVDEQAQVLDSASAELGRIRHGLRQAQEQLRTKLQSIISNSRNASYLQEALITMRGGRYVIPLKAEAKGQIKGIVHDQSSSGATLFIEPLATVELNNQIRELELAEEAEIDRILRAVTALIGADADRIVWTVEALGELDGAFAKAKYANAIRANMPTLVGFDPRRVPGATMALYHARHPLIDPELVVPIDVELDDETYTLVITGPNTGGKTVALKTIGLLTLMAQCGLHIPAAEGSILTVFETIHADIGDEQSIEQSLSTFSAHLTHIIRILDEADERSLVLLDELGAGTDPAEGSAIARAILSDLVRRGISTFVATHYPELKLYAHSTPGVRNASVEFDVETLSPTYRLIVGLPGRSNAIAISKRLGLRADIIEAARSYIGESDLQADDLLDEIHRTREEIRQTQARLVKAKSDVNALRDELHARLEAIEDERAIIIEQARVEARSELDAVQEEIGGLLRRLRNLRPTREESDQAAVEAVKEIREEVELLAEQVETPVERVMAPLPAVSAEESPPPALQVGDIVFIPRLNAEGEIVSLTGDEQIEAQVGQFRVRVEPDAVEWRSRPKSGSDDTLPKKYGGGIKLPDISSPGMELHLIGQTLEEALPTLEDYLDRAYGAGLPWVRIVHGKGAGILRKGVRETLRNHPLVKSYESAADNEGGEGATIARFASR